MAAINLDIGGNTSRLDRDIQKTVNKAYSINLKTKGDQPLGRITGKVNEFNKSLDASNARVIAFGASAGIIFGLQRAFSSLVTSTIEVQKSLQDINVILNVSTTQLNKFGSELFNIAKNTGQSFQEVAGAATEFSRQGLGLVETLKRTNEALILSRLSGLDTVKSVQALTAAVNSFASQAVTATEVVNKFANVDAAFAVSSADLADAISRVGSSAAQSGVSLNELIALVTSAQQTTARGGAVIGNSFKTIFTRLQRGKVVDLLGTLGISDTTAGGEIKSTIQLLQELGKVYDNLGAQQQAYVAEQVGGVFQINILKAALADLGKEYSVYNSALSTAEASTDQAIKRNEQLNKTYAAQLNALQQNAKQLAAGVGNRVLGPVFDRVVGGANELLGGVNESDGKSIGAVLGKGILDGIGQLLAGPGLVLIGGILLKLTKDFAKFGLESGKGLLGLNSAATQQKNLQESIGQILQNNPKLIDRALKSEQGLNQVANSLYATLQKQTLELQNQEKISQRIAKAFYGAGMRSSGGVPIVPTSGKSGKPGKAAGHIPNFAQGDFAREELLASALGARNPTAQLSKGTIDGRKFIKNNREVEITDFGKNGDSAVIPNYAKGFIPNFQKASQTPKEIVVAGAKKYGYLIPSTAPGRLSTPDKPIPGGTVTDTANNIKYIFPPQTAYGPKLIGESEASNKLENQIYQSVLNRTASYTKRLAPPGNPVSPSDLEKGFQSAKGARGAVLSAIGAAFEVGITTALGYEAASSKVGAGDFDVRAGKGIEKIQSLFGIGGITKADFKATTGGDSVTSFRKKILREEFGSFGKKGEGKPRASTKSREARKNIQFSMLRKKKNAAAGYIPNFAAIQDAVSRERAAGIPSNQIYLAQEQALTSANPMGLGVFNKKDEPTKGSRKDAMRKKGFARGYIPNFAEDVSAAPMGATIAALVAQLGTLAFFLKDIRSDMETSHKEAIETATNEISQDKAKLDSLKRGTAEHDKLNKKIKSSTESLKKMEAGSGKVASGLMASASTIMIAAPMLAALAKNAIGSETKGARAAGAAIEGTGQSFSFASMASMLGKTRGQKGLYAALAFLAASALTTAGVFTELGTDLPELARAAEKASQKLSEFENIGQQANTSLEQITDLRNKGQAKEAGAVEGRILTDIAKQVTDPNVAAQMQRAIINKDSEALRVAIEENSKILREERDKTDMSAAIQAGITGIESQTGGYFSKGNAEKQISEARSIFTAPLLDLKSATLDENGKEVRSTGMERFNQLQNFGRMNESGGTEGFRKILEELGYKGEDLNRLLEKEAILRGPFQKLINEQIESQANQLRNTEEGNSVVKQISDAMRNVRSKYDEYAKVVSQGVNNQISANSDIKNALARIEVGKLESNAEITEAFTGSGSTATRQAKTGAELAKIDSDFTTNINEPITEATRTLFDVLQSSVSTKIGTMATPGKDQNSAVMNFETLQASLLPLLESLNIENLQGILPSANEDFQGFDVKKIIDSVRQEVGETPSTDTQKGLETLEKQLNTANSILYEQRRIQQEQKVLLAQQKFTEIAKLFITGIKESMGGFEGFLKGTFNEDNQALQDAASAIRIIGSNPQTRGGQVEVGRSLGVVTTELSKLSGLNIGEELAKFAPNVIAQIEGGQSKYIEDNLNTVFNSLAGLDEGIAQAFRASLSKKFDGLGEDASNKEIADATAKAQTQMQYELVPALSDSIRKASIAQLQKEGGEGSQKLIDLLESPASAFLDPQSYTNMALDTSNKLLEQILAAINAPVDASTPATTPTVTPGYGGPAYDSGGAAGGFFPAFANSKESIIPNFKQQYEKEKRDQSKYGYSGGKPLPLSEENFNPLRDAIANPMQMALLGGMKSKSLGAAGGYFPNFAKGSSFLDQAMKILGIDPTGTAVASVAGGAGKANKAGKNRPPAKSSKKGPGGKGKNSRRPTPRGPDGRFIPKPGPNASGKTPTGMIANLAKGAKGYGKNVMKAIPGLGTLYSVGMGIKDYNENTKAGMDRSEAMVRAISDFAFGTAGSALGGFLGGALGTAIAPGVGTVAGGLVGGGLGYTGGTYLSRLIMDRYYGPKDRMKVDPTANPSTRPPPGATLKAKKLEMQKRNIKKFEKPDKKQLDEIKQAMGPDLPSLKERKAIADRENQAQLIRWQMGASAAFKNYDKDGVSTGIKSMYGQGGGQEVKGSNIDVTRQLTETNKALKASKSPRRSMALARKATALRQKIQSEILPKSEFIGKQGEGMGARTLINEAIAKGQTINAIDPKKPETGRKLSEANLEGLQRTSTGKDGKVIGYSRYNPKASKYREYSGPSGVYVDGKPYVDKSMGGAATELGTQIPNPTADLGKLERTKDKEQEEAGVPRSQIYSLNMPELVTTDNPDGTGVFNKEDERSFEEARKAVERVYSFGKIRTPTNSAGGYFPNFAEPSSTSNNINVSVGVNITAGASASSIDKDALSAQIQTLLEVEVPKLNALKARVDRLGEVVTKVQEGNPGKYNLPPKQVPK